MISFSGKTCININLTCNGVRDCPDLSDESHCNISECEKTNKCQQICVERQFRWGVGVDYFPSSLITGSLIYLVLFIDLVQSNPCNQYFSLFLTLHVLFLLLIFVLLIVPFVLMLHALLLYNIRESVGLYNLHWYWLAKWEGTYRHRNTMQKKKIFQKYWCLGDLQNIREGSKLENLTYKSTAPVFV